MFDAYGTLFDVHSAVGRHCERLGDVAGELSMLWRTKQLEYTWLRSLMRRHADFSQVTEDALDFAFDHFGIQDKKLREDLLGAYRELTCYPEVPQTLSTLKRSGLRVAILSNGSPALLEAGVKHAELDELIDETLSIEAVAVYKPDPRTYQLAVECLKVKPGEIAFQSSNGWDVAGAAAFGFQVAWINRFDQGREYLPFGPDAELKSLAEMPALLGI